MDTTTGRTTRRAFLQRSALLSGGLLAAGTPAARTLAKAAPAPAISAPTVVRGGRPEITHGVASGDVTQHGGIVWARADRRARMVVEVSPTESFANPRRVRGPIASHAEDFTAQLELHGLPRGRDIFYRVRFVDPGDPTLGGAPAVGHFRTVPRMGQDVSFTWSGDTAGQGWGIDPDKGGMRTYETMRQLEPDFFLHSGDTVYSDGPLEERVPLPDGDVWRNLVIDEKAKVAETLHEFRGQHRYNLLDANLRACNAEVPILAQWDDHETTNNWYPGEVLDDPRYTVTDVDLLARRAKRAFHEYLPVREVPAEDGRIYRRVSYGPMLDVFVLDLRTYRGPNTRNDQRRRSGVTAILGSRQLRWLQRELASSRATWKVIASDMPVGLVVPDGEDSEGIANGLNRRPLGRELEIAALLRFLQRRRVHNVVWLTADVHYTAAHHYHPDRAAFQDFDPFWEFVSGPLHAGTFGPNELDATFGPRVAYANVPEQPNLPPSAGLQFFGHVRIDGASEVMTVRLMDVYGDTLFSRGLPPA